jgi:hypothetical protein
LSDTDLNCRAGVVLLLNSYVVNIIEYGLIYVKVGIRVIQVIIDNTMLIPGKEHVGEKVVILEITIFERFRGHLDRRTG